MRLVVYAIRIEKGANGDRTIANVNYFLRHGVLASDLVRYVFVVVEGSEDDPRLEWGRAVSDGRSGNVCIRAAENFNADLCIYPSLLRELDLGLYHQFVFINSGSRGPFFEVEEGPASWLDRVTKKLKGRTALVGPTINCELYPHVQSYAMAMTAQALDIALLLWSDTSVEMRRTITRRDTIPAAMEVGFSRGLLAKGLGIEEWGDDAIPLSFEARGGRDADRTRMTLCTKRLGRRNPCNDPRKILHPRENIFVKYKHAMPHHPETVAMVENYTASADASRREGSAYRYQRIPSAERDEYKKYAGAGTGTGAGSGETVGSFRLGSTDVTACFDCTQDGGAGSRHCQGI
jgi:hypothetical protein